MSVLKVSADSSRLFRVATRKSKMAMTQTQQVIDVLSAACPALQFAPYPLTSDGCYERFQGDLSKIGGKGAFVKRLEIALQEHEADMAMHSLKDVPTDQDLPDGLVIPFVLPREDVRDAVVCRQGEVLAGLKAGQKVGTSSVRRAAQLQRTMPHLQIVPLRGNADTRVAKVDNGEVDAAILAKSGLERIGLAHRITDVFEPDIMLPSVGQGAVCVECRMDDAELMDMLTQQNHIPSFQAVMAERAMLQTLGGSCHTPLAGYAAWVDDTQLHLTGMVLSLDGTTMLRAEATGAATDYMYLGETVADDLLSQGARVVLDACEAAA